MRNISTFVIILLLLGYSIDAWADQCPEKTLRIAKSIQNKLTCALQGTYEEDLTLTPDISWVLDGVVTIGTDQNHHASLSILPGTHIFAYSGLDFLVIHHESQIIAEGTPVLPIVFTTPSRLPVPGSWGGIVITGTAPVGRCVDEPEATCIRDVIGGLGQYGGTSKEASSGVLKYVRIEYAGFPILPNRSLGGLALFGVGSNTVIENVQVYMSASDGIRVIGGTVGLKNIVISVYEYAGLRWRDGWTGNTQFLLIESHPTLGVAALVGDGNSHPIMSNVRLLGQNSESAKSQHGIWLRSGSALSLYNSVITNFKGPCIDLDGRPTFEAAAKVNDQGEFQPSDSHYLSNLLSCGYIEKYKDDKGKPAERFVDTTFAKRGQDLWSIEEWFTQLEKNYDRELIGINAFLNDASKKALYADRATPDLSAYIELTWGELMEDPFFTQPTSIGAVSTVEDWTLPWALEL